MGWVTLVWIICSITAASTLNRRAGSSRTAAVSKLWAMQISEPRGTVWNNVLLRDVLKLIGDSDTHLKKLQSQPSMYGMSFHKRECVHRTPACSEMWGKKPQLVVRNWTGQLEGGLVIKSPGSHMGNNGGFYATVGSFYIRRNSQVRNVVGRRGTAWASLAW